MIFFLYSATTLTVLGITMLACAVHIAPEGYEDEKGFHRVG